MRNAENKSPETANPLEVQSRDRVYNRAHEGYSLGRRISIGDIMRSMNTSEGRVDMKKACLSK